MCGVSSWTLHCRYCGEKWGIKWQDIGTVLQYNHQDGKFVPCHALRNGTVCCFLKWRRRNDDTCGADPAKVMFKACDKDACQDADRRAMRQMEEIKASQEACTARTNSEAYSERVRELVEGAAAEDEDLHRRYRPRRLEAPIWTQRQDRRQEEDTGFLADFADRFTLDTDWLRPVLHLSQDMEEWEITRQQRRTNQQAQGQQLQQQQNMKEDHSGQSHHQHEIENDRLEAALQLEQETEKHRRIDEYIQTYRQWQPRDNSQAYEPLDESWFREFVEPGVCL